MNTNVVKIDRTKSLKEQRLQLLAAAGMAAAPEPDNQNDCSLEEGCNDDVPFEDGEKEQAQEGQITPPLLPSPSSQTSSSSQPEILLPEEADELFNHKLGEAILPVALVGQFIKSFPGAQAHRVSQLAGKFGSPASNMRHVLIYDTYENLKKFER